MDKWIYREYVAILKEELQPAMGCTEPIAVAAGSSSVSRVSIQVTMAIFLSGYLFVMYFSYPLVSTKVLLKFNNSSIITFIFCIEYRQKYRFIL